MAATVRVDDYLGDKIQTAADLGVINDLLEKVREQQHLLRDQLSAAKSELSQTDIAAQALSQSLHERTNRFQRDQADIDRRLHTLTQSQASDDATKVFEAKMQRLSRLELASGYVEILQEVDVLVQQAQSEIDNPPGALAKYSRLCTLLSNLRQSRRAADEAAPHLLDHLEQQAGKLYQDLKQRLGKSLQGTLERMQWPKKDLKLHGDVVETWADQVGWLLDLQEADRRTRVDMSSTPSVSPTLLPLEVMVRPLVLRFQYHFYGDRPTNRLDKPEYFFSHLLDLVEQANPFMTQLLQPVLDVRAQKSGSLEIHYPDAISAFITALLPVALAKCLSILPQITSQPQLLSHFMHESLTFDNTLRESWAYTPVGNAFADWRGLSDDILVKHGYFELWLEVEKSFALSRYKKIRDNPESNQIDYDGGESSRTKPTKGALRVNDLLETVTDRYRLLSSFSQKIKFFLDIQLSIFDDYHGHLHGALQAYLMTSHTAGRLIQGGGQSQDDVMGIRGLESLVKIFGSAEYLERKMSDWSEDVFFLELWDELQDRARGNGVRQNGTVGQDLKIDDVASRTSASIKPEAQESEHESDGGALFDEISKTYRTLRERAESEIVRALETQARNALKPYGRVTTWSSIASAARSISDLTPSSSLDTLLATLSTLLTFLSGSLAAPPLRRMVRPFCIAIQKELVDAVIMKHTFSTAGAMQLRRDVIAIQDVIDTSLTLAGSLGGVTSGESRRSMRKLEDTLTLLTLPIRQTSGQRQLPDHNTNGNDANGDGDDNGWGFDDDENNDANAEDRDDDNEEANAGSFDAFDSTGASLWNLWAFEKAIFASNESAREALAAMHLDQLTELEARNVIRRRVELSA